LSGTNFGFNPVVTIGDLGCIVFSNSTPTPAQYSSPCQLSSYTPSQSSLTFDFPRGVGTGFPLMLTVAGQTLLAPVVVSYKPPIVSAVNLVAGASTRGGSVGVLTGRNFGSNAGANAVIQLVRVNGTGARTVFECNPLAPQVRCIVLGVFLTGDCKAPVLLGSVCHGTMWNKSRYSAYACPLARTAAEPLCTLWGCASLLDIALDVLRVVYLPFFGGACGCRFLRARPPSSSSLTPPSTS
jgi:hypothetical protein